MFWLVEGKHGSALAEAVHRRHDAVVGALATTCVGGLAAALDTDRGADVAQFHDTVGYAIVDHGGVGEDHEHRLGMTLDDVEQWPPDEGFATEHDKDTRADLFTLVDDALDLSFGELVFVVVFGRVAPHAAQVAAHGGAD